MPPWMLVGIIAIVVVTVLSVFQGAYWAWVARRERQQLELVRRLGSGQNVQDTLFLEQEEDRAVQALGTLGRHAQQVLMTADTELSVSGLFMRCAIMGSVGMVLGGIAVGLPGMLVGMMLSFVPYALIKRQATQRSAQLVEQLPDSLELMSRSLQAGLGLNDTFRLVAEEMPVPISTEFGRVFEEVRFGRDFRDAFGKMLDRNPGVFDLRLMISSILLQRETGGNLIEILENIAETIRSRFVFDAKLKAMTAEARISATILGGLPMVVAGLLSVINPAYLVPLFEDPKGHFILAGCAILYTAGVLIMRDLSKVEV